MDWVVDRDDFVSVVRLADDVDRYVRRDLGLGARPDVAAELERALRTMLGRLCRCAGPSARVVLVPVGEDVRVRAMAVGEGIGGDVKHRASCDVRAEVTVATRRGEPGRFTLESVDPGSLPTPEEFRPDGWVGREAFLKALVVQAIAHMERDVGRDAVELVVTKVGCDVGNRMEDEYRRVRGIVERLSPSQMAELFVGLKEAIGGDFYVVEADEAQITLRNRRCPFGDAVRKSPALCRMTSSVFGGIAARNAGFSAVCLDERIAVGDKECCVRVLLRPERAAPAHADHYGGEARALRVAIVAASALLRELLADGMSHHRVDVVAALDHAAATPDVLRDLGVDVVLFDLPERDTASAVDLAIHIRESDRAPGVVVVCEEPDREWARRLLVGRSGVGHLLKDDTSDLSSFVAALRTVANGGTVISPGITASLAATSDDELADLTTRELEVLALVADGFTNQVIADKMVISKRAVEKHLGNVFRKLRLTGQTRDRRMEAALMYRGASASGQ